MVSAGLIFLGLIIKTVFAAVILAVVIWLLVKFGRLIDAYRQTLEAKK